MVVLFDTETTSLQPGQIAQLAYVVVERGASRGKNYFFTVDGIDPASAAVNGMTVEYLREASGGRVFEDDLFSFRDDFERADFVAAHNFVFDMIFMSAEYRRCGDVFHVKQRFDTMKHFTPVLKLPSRHAAYKFPRLGELTAWLGIGDAEIEAETARLFGLNGRAHDSRYDVAALSLVMSRGRDYLPPELIAAMDE